MKLHGADRLNRLLATFTARARPHVAAALYQQAEAVLTRSKAEFVPVDTGALRNSGHVVPPDMAQPVISVTIGFGGPAAPYAAIVHEDLTKRHPVGGAKYLSRPLREAIPRIRAAITAAITRALRGR